MKVYNEKKLGKALHENVSTIELEAVLGKKVMKIKATGKVAWGVLLLRQLNNLNQSSI